MNTSRALARKALSVLPCLLLIPTPSGASVEVVLATDQTPGDAAVARVAWVAGGVWDRAGRVLMSGTYQPSPPGAVERNAVWAWTGSNTARELYADGDMVPYFSMPVTGPVIPMSVPRIQPRFGGYVPPPDYWVFRSAVASRPPEVPESLACWVDRLNGIPGVSPTIFVVNDLETHEDGVVRFIRPQVESAIIRERTAGAGLPDDVTFTTPGGGAMHIYFNASYQDNASGRGGPVVWIARSDLAPVISERKNVVRMIAAGSGMQLPSLPGGTYSQLRVLGVDRAENLLWEAGNDAGRLVLRGEPGLWTTLLAPGMPAPPARSDAPSPATPLGAVGTVALVDHGTAFMAEANYAAGAGALAGRAALLLHDGHAPRLMALEGEVVDGTLPGTLLQRFTPGGYDWADTNLVAFYGPVRGGTLPFETQALLLAGANNVWMLARQYDPLPAPPDVDRVLQFRFPVLSARPDGTVAFAAEVEFLDGTRREILYTAAPGRPNQVKVVLSAGDTFSVPTPDGPRVGTIRRFNSAYWKPGSFDKLLVSVDLHVAGTSAVLLVDPEPPPAVRLDVSLDGGRLRLRWPEAAGGALEVGDPAAPGSWSPLELPVTVRDGYREVAIETLGTARFFRLRQTP